MTHIASSLSERRARAAVARALLLTPLACAAAAWAQTADNGLSTAPAPASAPASSSADTTALPSVVIKGESDKRQRTGSAARLDLSVKDTPQSLTVISQEQIRDFGLTDINRLLDLVPGVNVERVETDRTYYSARGFDITNFMMDGLGQPFANGALWGTLDTAAYERVDILRGATGLMAPTGNPSATVNFVRKRAESRSFEASADLTVGAWNRRRVDADVSTPLNADGSLRGRLVVADDNSDSYLDRYSKHTTLVHSALSWDLSRDTQLSLGYTQQRTRSNGVMWGALPMVDSNGQAIHYDRSASSAADWSWWNNTDEQAFAELNHDLGNGWQVKATVSDRRVKSDSELFYVYGTPNADTTASPSGYYGYPSAFQGTYRDQMADVAATGRFSLWGREQQVVVGASTARQTMEEYSGYPSDTAVVLPDLHGWNGDTPKPSFDASSDGSDVVRRRHTAYAAVHLSPTAQLQLVGGLTVSKVTSKGISYAVEQQYSRSAVKPYAGVLYDLTPNTNVYVSYAEMFNPQIETTQAYQVLKPAEGSNLEAGVKSQWLNKRLTTSAALFRTRQTGIAESAGYRADFSTYYLPIEATSTGYELEISGELAPGWTVMGGWTQFRLKGNRIETDADGVSSVSEGTGYNVRTWVPRKTLRLGTAYTLTPQIKLNGAVRWQAKTSDDDQNTVVQKQYTLLDVGAAYEFNRHWSTHLGVTNLLDKTYLNSLKWGQAYYGEPRAWSLRLSYRY
ncbi:TonB-dependent siderophore receptor [Roseateles sp. SL47]|uniref:TonB-dependent siderophore receptor n=1 Tax=Roseateles sp. SL47 TaxID=2995138 RepID=UPI00226D4852|nr:TonB-dependent siderophore receptor [Roseateles sp. SL47]WAC73895.1 TonB-dependent siderophore receptor [Roseateles sp. SL47]